MKVLIIGAGVAGLGIGWRLVQSGVEVHVIERAQVGRGATWASAGMLAVLGELGDEESPEMEFARHARALWPGFAKELKEKAGLDIGYRENGAVIVARTAEEETHLARGQDVRRLTPAEACALEPMLTPDIHAAVLAPGEAQVNSRALGEALARAFVRGGGKLTLNETVLRIEVEGKKAVAVRAAFGRHEADAIILAAGAWSGLVEGLPEKAVPPVKPVKGEMIALEPRAGARPPEHVVWGNGVYLVPRGDRLLVGATMEDTGFDTRVTRQARNWLYDRAVALMPSLKEWDVVDHWSGLRPGSPDGLPMLGPTIVERLYLATGQFRNGILFAPAVAELLCRLVLEQRSETLAFDPRRFS